MKVEMDNELKIITLLGGYVRELREGKDYEQTTYELAKRIINMIDAENESYHQSKVESVTDSERNILCINETSGVWKIDAVLARKWFTRGMKVFKQELLK